MESISAEVVAAVGAMGTTVAYLFRKLWQEMHSTRKSLEARAGKIEDELKECRDEHKERSAQMLKLTREVGQLTGIETMSSLVLNEVRSLKDDA